MTWANKGLPTYIAISSSRKAGRLHEGLCAVQVGDTMKISVCDVKYGFQSHGIVFNRTLVLRYK
jgi:hypothetical protein